ncbi:MAG: rane protein [Frankiales bacterium]|nr:rane protein [Frankiales bacterium]
MSAAVIAPAGVVATTGARTRTAWGVTALVALFLAFDGVTHVLQVQAVTDSFRDLGYPDGSALGIGVVELVCLGLYLLPRTAPLGAVLLTGYLGGAVAAQLRVEAPLLSTALFPVYTGVLVWGGLALRDRRVLQLVRRGPVQGA